MKIPKPIGRPRKVWGIVRPLKKAIMRQDFRFPDGTVREFYLFTSRRGLSVLVFPVTAKGEVVLLNQWRPGACRCVLEVPGGSLEKGQSVRAAAAKELLEETGYRAGRLLPLPSFWADPTNYSVAFLPFLALDCRKVQRPMPEASELLETKKMPLKRWLAHINKKNAINDGKTLALTLLAMPHLKKYLR
jgi:ADP-ribose pyrophosphatase